MVTFLIVLFVINCVLLTIVVLLQSRGGAEVGIFGGSNLINPFGSRTSDVLSKITRILGISFMILALVISFLVSKSEKIQPKAPAINQPVQQEQNQSVPQQNLPLPNQDNKNQ